MIGIFQRIFGIYPNEGIKSLRFATLTFFAALGITILETLSDGFFIEKAGASSLPIMFLITSISMICISTLVLYTMRYTSAMNILSIVILMGAILSIVAAIMMLHNPGIWFWFAFKIASRMIFAVLIACIWTFIDQYHDLQDAKRVYSLYSASFFLGSICSGLLISFTLQYLKSSSLLFIALVTLIAAFDMTRRIAKRDIAVPDDSTDGVHATDRSAFSTVVQLISRSPFTIYLLSLSLITQLLITVTEYSYMDSFGKALTSNHFEGTVAEFLGKCRAIISACNIIIGFFFYSRFLGRVGLCNAILVTPLFFFGVYAQWMTQETLWIAVMGLIAVDGILFTVEDNCFNLLSNAVPTKLKSKVRIINDSFFEPIGMLLSALLLIALQSNSRILGMGLTLTALFITLFLRFLYPQALLMNLRDNAIHFEKKLKDWIVSMGRKEQKETQNTILTSLKSNQEEIRLLACESLLSLQNASLLPQILTASQNMGTVSKIRLLHLFEKSTFSHDPRLLYAVSTWVEGDASPELSKWANFFLAKRGLHSDTVTRLDINNSDPLLRGSAILKLLNFDKLRQNKSKNRIVNQKIDQMFKSNRIDEIIMALDLIGLGHATNNIDKVIAYLDHESTLIRRSAAQCISTLASPDLNRYAMRIIDHLAKMKDNAFRLHCIDAIGKMQDPTTIKDILMASVYFRPNERRRTEEIIIAMGEEAVAYLRLLIKDLTVPDRSRILAVKILGRLALPELQENVTELLDQEINRAYFYFYYGYSIQKRYPYYDLELLQNALVNGFRSVVDFIIHLLGATGALSEPEMILRALSSQNAKIHSHAIETLEKSCPPRLYSRFVPLLDDLPLDVKLSTCLKYNQELSQLSLTELLTTLERSGSLYDNLLSARLKSILQMPTWRQQLRDQIQKSDEQIEQCLDLL